MPGKGAVLLGRFHFYLRGGGVRGGAIAISILMTRLSLLLGAPAEEVGQSLVQLRLAGPDKWIVALAGLSSLPGGGMYSTLSRLSSRLCSELSSQTSSKLDVVLGGPRTG